MSRVTRSLCLTLFLAAGLMLPGWSAAKGGAPFHFEKRYYVPGEMAHGTVSFGKGSVGLHMMDRGPFYAYLLPGDAYIDPPRIPSGAIPLGQIRMTRIDDGYYRAALAFTVPDVADGWHTIGYCNVPCTVASVGEFTGGWFQVFSSHDEARTQLAMAHLKERLSQIRTNHRQLKQQLADRREAQERTLVYARRSNAELAERVDELDAELAAARARERESNWPAIAGWTLFGTLLLANLGFAAARIRRRRRRGRMRMDARVVGPSSPPERDLEPVP